MATRSQPPPPVDISRTPLANFTKTLTLNPLSKRAAPSLPTLRLLLSPKPGLAFDARLPLTQRLRCFLSLESYFHGTSQVRIGLESNRFPFLRLELAPSTTLSIRPAPFHLSDLKFGILGASLAIYNAGQMPALNLASPQHFWESIRPFVRPVVEINHRNTLLGSFVDPQQRKRVQDVISDFKGKGKDFPERLRSSRDGILKSFGRQAMPTVDPRQRPEPNGDLKERLKTQMDRLSDPSSIQKPDSSFWPEKSLINSDEQGVQPNKGEESDDPTRDSTKSPSVLGHVKQGKHGRLSLKRLDGGVTTPSDDDVLNDMEQRGPLDRLRYRLLAPFSKSDEP